MYKYWSIGVLVFLLFFQVRAQENLITNGSFTDDSGWDLGEYSEGAATGAVANNSYTIAISAPGTVVWAVQFTQSGIMLDSAVAYTLSCSISSTIERTMEVSLSQDEEPYRSYSGRDTLKLSSTSYKYEKLFVMKQPSDSSARLEFNCGKDTGTISVSDVKLVKYTEKKLAVNRPLSGEIIYAGIPYTISWQSVNVHGDLTIELSGDKGSSWTKVDTVHADTGVYTWVPEAIFSSFCRVRLKSVEEEVVAVSDGEFELVPQVNLVRNGFFADERFWDIGIYGGTADGGVSEEGTYHIRIDTAASENWQIQLTQSGVNLVEDKQYHFSFIAYGAEATTMNINIGMDHEPYTSYLDSAQLNVPLTAEPERYEFIFTMKEKSDSSARIEFNCGIATEDIFIDEVRLYKEYVAPVTAPPTRGDRNVSAATQRRILFGNYPIGRSFVSTTGHRTNDHYIIDLRGRRVGSMASRLKKSPRVLPMTPGVYLLQSAKTGSR